MNIRNRIICIFTALLVVVAGIPIQAFAGGSTGGAGSMTEGGVGSYHNALFRVGYYFVTPKQEDETGAIYSLKNLVMGQTGESQLNLDGAADSPNSSNVFFLCDDSSVNPRIKLLADCTATQQRRNRYADYGWYGYNFNNPSYSTYKSYATTIAAIGSQTSLSGSFWNPDNPCTAMKELCGPEYTNYGEIWNGDKIYEYLCTKLIDGNGSEYQQLEKDIVAMWYLPYTGARVATTPNSAKCTEWLKNIWVYRLSGSGQNYNGKAITNDIQGKRLQDLMIACMAIVIDKQHQKVYGTKSNLDLKKWLQQWCTNGGNSNMQASNGHLMIKADVWAYKLGSGNSHNVIAADRYDYAIAMVHDGLNVMEISKPNWKFENNNRIPTERDYDSKNLNLNTQPDPFYTYWVQGLVAREKNGSNMKITYNSKLADDAASHVSIFQGIAIKENSPWPGITKNGSWNYRKMLYTTYWTKDDSGNYKFYKNIQAGWTMIYPMGPNPGPTPNEDWGLHHDVEVNSVNTNVAKGGKGSCNVKINLTFPQIPDAADINKYKLNVKSFKGPEVDKLNMAEIINRASNTSNIESGDPNIPVTITVNRAVTSSDSKMYDSPNAGEMPIYTCGKHSFTCVSDNGKTAVFKFNLIPSGKSCGSDVYTLRSDREKLARGASDVHTDIHNCALCQSLIDGKLTISFRDDNIDVPDTKDTQVPVTYTVTAKYDFPKFKAYEQAYGTVDPMRNLGTVETTGYSVLPEDGAYPKSDWVKSGAEYAPSLQVQRTVDLLTDRENPSYTNKGIESARLPYAEIKQGNPKSEEFEAMAGTPTTKDLYLNCSGNEFYVDFIGQNKAVVNPQAYREYKYIVHCNGCTNNHARCNGHNSCDNPGCDGHGKDRIPCSGNHKQHTDQHPIDHTYTFTLHIPIEAFEYFDMTKYEVWRMTNFQTVGGDSKVGLNVSNDLPTHFYGLDVGNYASGNGRLLFTKNQNSTRTSNPNYGNNEIDLGNVAEGTDCGKTNAINLANTALKNEPAFKAICISDFMIFETSNGIQTPYYYSYSTNEVAPSTQGTFSSVNQDLWGTNPLKWEKHPTFDDLWTNNAKNQCASQAHGWDTESICYEGYNGKYSTPSEKYNNPHPGEFYINKNLLKEDLAKCGLTTWAPPATIRTNAWNSGNGSGGGQIQDHTVPITPNRTAANGEYYTGKVHATWVREALSGKQIFYPGKPEYTNTNVKYYDGADKVNDIVFHNPVSAENAMVVTNDPQYDKRTNAKLMQGGDPPNIGSEVCPAYGCQYSTLKCTEPITYHTDACYSWVETVAKTHVGGLNAHEHTDACYADIKLSGNQSSGFTNQHLPAGAVVKCLSGQNGSHYSYFYITKTNYTDRVYITPGSSYTVPSDGYYTLTPYSHCSRAATWEVTGLGKQLICDKPMETITARYFDIQPGEIFCNPIGNYHNGSFTNLNAFTTFEQNGVLYYKNATSNTIRLNTTGCSNHGWSCTITKGGRVNNVHVCTPACKAAKKEKVLTCTNPHHVNPGESTDLNDPAHHYPLGDPRCWQRCGNDANHRMHQEVKDDAGNTIKMGGTFINLDREFKIYFPYNGDFAEKPGLYGIAETTATRGKGYINDMPTKTWTAHRYVTFPFNVIDQTGKLRTAGEHIDLNQFSKDDLYFTFYCVLNNVEAHHADVVFSATANNGPGAQGEGNGYWDESVNTTNKDRIDPTYAARHTASKDHYIDVVGSIGSLTIHDTGDYRFANLFKMSRGDGSWLIDNLVPMVYENVPNKVVADKTTSRLDVMAKPWWLSTYGMTKSSTGGKGGNADGENQPLTLPLAPWMNPIEALRNQPMRPGYQLYMDFETVGNYYGTTLNDDCTAYVDANMLQKAQIRPRYYSLDLKTHKYTPVDVYYGVDNEYMLVNQWTYEPKDDKVGVKDFYYYLDWGNEASRRSYTQNEREATNRVWTSLDSNDLHYRIPSTAKDVIGSANILFLNDLNRTFIGSSKTYGQDKNPGSVLPETGYNQQSQRWHFTLGLPSSTVFVEKGKPCTEANIKALQSKHRVIVCTLNIKVRGSIWTLDYDGHLNNNGGFKVLENGDTYQPPMFDENGNETLDPTKDVTSGDIVVVVYPSDKTSKDDVTISGTH